MHKTPPPPSKDALTRRLFLRNSVTLGAGAVSLVILPAQTMAEPSASEPDTDARRDGYHMSEHIAAYYESADV